MNKKNILKIVLMLCSVVACGQAGATKTIDERERFALVTSGGISLGVYEAGLNWVLSEYAYKYRRRIDLKSLTGASAGAVNTIFSAVRKCLDDDVANKDPVLKESSFQSLENNPFWLGWKDLDITTLIPENQGLYDKFAFPKGEKEYPDGLINREVYAGVLRIMSDYISKPVFRAGCSVNMGMPVTRDVPVEFPINNSSSESSIKMQRFSIPVVEYVDERKRLLFKNNIEYSKDSPERGYIFLPEDKDRNVAFSDIVRAALTSSAFPIAFGRVKLDYCIRSRNGTETEIHDEDNLAVSCPDLHHGETFTFVDGGIFDNIPLGLAVDLTECTNPKKYKENIYCKGNDSYKKRKKTGYVFMDPDKRRGFSGSTGQKSKISDDYDLKNQLAFFAGSVEVARKDELYSTIMRNFSGEGDNSRRSLLITRRYPPITAKYLNYFGAFLSQSFRDYDYYAGIYDGIVNVGLYEYRKNNSKHKFNYKKLASKVVEKIGRVSERLVASGEGFGIKDNKKAFQVFSMLAQDEFELKQDAPGWEWLIKEDAANNPPGYQNTFNFKLYELLKELEASSSDTKGKDKKSEFTLLLEGLKEIKEKNRDDPVISEVFKNDRFLNGIDSVKTNLNKVTKRIFSRLKTLEQNAKDGSPFVMKLASIAVDARNEKHNLNTWKADSNGNTRSKLWWLVPNEIAADVIQTGGVFTYLRTEIGEETPIGSPDDFYYCHNYMEFEGLRLHSVRDANGREDFVSTGLSLRCAFGARLSSLGLGYRYYYSVNNDNPNLSKQGTHGVGLSIGFLADKIRVGVEYRFVETGFEDEKYLLTIGISDFRGMASKLAD